MNQEINLYQITIDYFPILLSIFALIFSIKALRNGIREKVYDTQINHIKELISLTVKFSQIIDYSNPQRIRDYLNKMNDSGNVEKMIQIYLEFDIKLNECRFLLPKKIFRSFFNLKYQMSCVIETFDKKTFEIIRSRYFSVLTELENDINKKFNIKNSTKENINIFK